MSGITKRHITGCNRDIPTTATEKITSSGTYLNTVGDVAVRLVSSSANDAVAGSGALTCLVTGYSATGVLQTSTITMTGVTPSSVTTELYSRILVVEVLTAGTAYGSNSGTITCEKADGTDIILMDAGIGVTRSANYTVPLGKRAIVRQINMNASLAGYVLLDTVKDSLSAAPVSLLQETIAIANNSQYQKTYDYGSFILEPLEQLSFRCTNNGGTNSVVSVTFDVDEVSSSLVMLEAPDLYGINLQ